MKAPTLSVVIPVYNEEKRLHNLSKIIPFFLQKHVTTEIIIVNDGSTDKTFQKLLTYKKTYPRLQIIHNKMNSGKGHAIKTGMTHALGKYHLFMDIDISTPLETINDMLPLVDKYDIIIGSRKRPGAKLIKRQPFVREKLGVLFTTFAQIFLGLSITDFTCGFKLFSKKASKRIFSLSAIDRWGFDCELFVIAKLYSFSVYELPVIWKNDSATKVKFPNDIINSLHDLFRIKIYELTSRYKREKG